MRSYLDIIIDLKDGKKPDYEEVRLACLMANNLLFFAEQDIKHLSDPNTSKFVRDLTLKSVENRFYSRKKSPEEYLGNHHPDNPQQKKAMELGNKILNKILSNKCNHNYDKKIENLNGKLVTLCAHCGEEV